MSGIYSQISPSSIGEDYRDLQVAFEYGRKLSTRSNNIDYEKLYTLVHRYPSHDFVIDHMEARDLFKVVENAPPFLYSQVLADPALFMQPRGREPVIRVLTHPVEPSPADNGMDEGREEGGADAKSEGA
jgi:hypothetical protein